jgi:hypothetical protein
MSMLDESDLRYAIYFPDDDKVLELLSDGVPTLTCDTFRAKIMPSAIHANQLAHALKLTNYRIVTILCKIEL